MDRRSTTGSHLLGLETIAATDNPMDELRNQAISIVNELDIELVKAKRRPGPFSTHQHKKKNLRASKQITTGWLLAMALLSQNSFASDLTTTIPDERAGNQISLTEDQLEEVFAEANLLYKQARQLPETDQAVASERFALAAEKYELLINQGILNADLFVNLGNSYLQTGQLGHAIANYLRALKTDPSNVAAQINLEFARARLASKQGETDTSSRGPVWSTGNVVQWIRFLNEQFIRFVGRTGIQWTLAMSSLCFWVLLIVRGPRVKVFAFRLAIIPLTVLLIAGGSLYLSESDDTRAAIVVIRDLELRSGDGAEFEVVHRIENAEGQQFKIVATRNEWLRIRDIKNREGWVNRSAVETISNGDWIHPVS
jgi:tetratricopeptide (TPR) repeat protein